MIRKTAAAFITIFLLLMPGLLPAPLSASEDFPSILMDMDGNPVLIKKKPSRIISLSAGTTEILFSLGAEKAVIAISDECNYPPQAKRIVKVGGIYLDYERIVGLKPDLIIIDGTLRARESRQLKKLGLPVLTIKSANYRDFIHSLILIGRSVGCREKAVILKKNVTDRISQIQAQTGAIPHSRRPRVYVEIWNRPLLTAGGDTFIGNIVETAGGINIFAHQKGYPQVNPETLLMKDPDVVILTTSTVGQFSSHHTFRNIKAVKNRRVHAINPDLLVRPTLRLQEACLCLSRWFYPRRNNKDKHLYSGDFPINHLFKIG